MCESTSKAWPSWRSTPTAPVWSTWPEELGQQEDRAVSIALRCQAFVAFASFAGPTGGGYTRTAGSSAIWSPTGEALARAGTRAGEFAKATLMLP